MTNVHSLVGNRFRRPWLLQLLAAIFVIFPTYLAGVGVARAGSAVADPPMQVQIVEQSGAACMLTCQSWIAVQGRIVHGSAKVFAAVLKTMGKRRLTVRIASLGGDVVEAIEIGRLIRAQKLDVEVSRTIVEPCFNKQCASSTPPRARSEPFGAPCASACVFILASGTARVAAWNSPIGVHQIARMRTLFRQPIQIFYRDVAGTRVEQGRRFIGTPVLVKKYKVGVTPREYRPIEEYLAEMGIRPALVRLMMATSFSGVHWMTQEEQKDTALVTKTLWPNDAPRSFTYAASVPAARNASPSPLSPWPPSRPEIRLLPPQEDKDEHAMLDLSGKYVIAPKAEFGKVLWGRDADGRGIVANVDVGERSFSLAMRMAPAGDGAIEAETKIAYDPLRHIIGIQDLQILAEQPPLAPVDIPISVRRTAADTFVIRFTEPPQALADHLLGMRRPWIVLHLAVDGERTLTVRFEHAASTPLLTEAFARWTQPGATASATVKP